MPFKHNAAHCHRIPRARYKVTNWPAYEAGLRRRGDITFWVDEAALAGWHAPRRSTAGGQPHYSDLAIELVLTRRLVFHLALRQAEGFARSILALLGLDPTVPDHTTLSRRGRVFAGRQPRVRAGSGPVHLVLDSTGLELFGQGEWCAAKHGRLRRRWLKLHIGVDAITGEIVRTQVAFAHPARSAGRSRPRHPGAQPNVTHRKARLRPSLTRAWQEPCRLCSAPCTNALEQHEKNIPAASWIG